MDVLLDPLPTTASVKSQLYPVLLSGGAGTRLWPLSRQSYPKQFLSIVSDLSMLQETALRTDGNEQFAAPLVVCNADHYFVVQSQLRVLGIEPTRTIVEPIARNTAPAIASAALTLVEQDPDAIMLVQPSDHFISDNGEFLTKVEEAAALAARNYLVTFGVTATSAETGYGYIQRGTSVDGKGSAYRAARFHEKPGKEAAEAFVADGCWYWNSGIFVLSAQHYLEELERQHPGLVGICRDGLHYTDSESRILKIDHDVFSRCPSISIDNAVMEHADSVAVIPLGVGWSDVGSWKSLLELGDADESGNVLSGDVTARDSSNSFFQSTGPMIRAIGISNLVVVATDDAVFISATERASDVRDVVADLRHANRSEADHHRLVRRPWGHYETVDVSARFQVKRITVEPGASLSLQMHHHRAEHWIVVAGTARVTCDDEVLLLAENQHIYIPLGATHRIENPGLIPLQLIEVQSGAYLGEDDIVRFEDAYDRE